MVRDRQNALRPASDLSGFWSRFSDVPQVCRAGQGERVKAGHAHEWTETGRLPVSLVHRRCACGKQKIQIVHADGRALEFNLPSMGAGAKRTDLRKAGAAVEIGRELWDLWQRLRRVVA